MAGPGNILIKIGAEAGQAVRELSTVNRALGDTQSSTEKMHAGLRKAALPAAAALAALGVAAVDATKAAAEDAAEQERLAGVLQRTTGATDAQVKANESWIASLSRATGVADDELRPAMAKLASATGDVNLAQKDLQTVLDISAASGKSVEQVSTAVAKAYTGQTAGLNKLIPGLDQATLKSKDMSAIMGELADKTGGAMAAQAETAAGKYAIFTNQMNELKESLGAGLLPIVQAFLPILSSMADFAANNTTAIQVLVGVVAALAGGILIANGVLKAYAIATEAVTVAQKLAAAAAKAWTGIQWLLNAALDANPIGLVVIAVGALTAAIILAYKHSETFRNIVDGALAAIETAFQTLLGAAQTAFNWIVAHWKVGLFAFGPIGVAVAEIIANFDKLQNVAETVFGAIKAGISGIASAIESVISAAERLIGALSRIHVPHIDLNPFKAVPSAVGAAPASRAGVAPFSGGAVTVNVYGSIDPEGTARSILRLLSEHDRRQGRR